MASSTWTNSAGGNWASTLNWGTSTHHVPVAGDTANLTAAFAGADYDVLITDSESAAIVNIGVANAELIVEAGGILTATTINLTAGTLNVLTGAEIDGATIVAGPGSSFVAVDGTLAGTTWHGPLVLDGFAQASLLTVTGSLTLLNASGTGSGELDVTGPGAEVDFSTMTLDGKAGDAGLQINVGLSSNEITTLGVTQGATLTIGSHADIHLDVAGSFVQIKNVGSEGALVNNGMITANAGAGSSDQVDLSSFTNNGTIAVGSGSLFIVGSGTSFTGTGVVDISGGTVDMFGYTGSVVFAVTGGRLNISGTSMPSATIGGFAAGDIIDLAGAAFASGGSATLLSGNVLRVVEGGQSYNLNLNPSQSFAGEQFAVSSDGGSGTKVIINRAPVVTPASLNVTAVHSEISVAASSLFTASDPDGDAIAQYALWDTGGSGHWSVNGVAQAAGVEIDITAAQWAQTTYVFGVPGTLSDQLYVKAYDGSLWGAWTTAVSARPFADHAPVAFALSLTATHNQLFDASTSSSVFTVSDSDGDAITEYGLWDTDGNGHWVVNGVAQSANVEIDVTSRSGLAYQSGSGTDHLYVRAYDGTLWSAWAPFTVTGPTDRAPVTTPAASGVVATHGQKSIAASNLFHATDPDGDAITQYALWDTGGSGHWRVNGVTQAAGVEIDITAAQWAQTTYVFGATGTPSDELFVKASDGLLWGNWTSALIATPGPDHAPVAFALSLTATHNQLFDASTSSSVFTVSDSDGDAITEYGLWDTDGNGHWVVNGVTQSTNVEIDVTSRSGLAYQSGSGTDHLYVRAYDGTLWSAWAPFTVTGPTDRAPVTTPAASGVVATHGQKSIAASNLFHATDPDGDAITQYALWDTGGSGHWSVNGVAQAAGVEIDITAAQWAQTTYVFGATGTPSDQLFVKASDGLLWGNWTSALIATPGPDHAPGAFALSLTATHNQLFDASTSSSVFTVSDSDGDAITEYGLWDTDGNGHWVVNGVAQSTNVEIDVTSRSGLAYQSGSGTDHLYVRAYDGTLWSAWAPFTVTGPTDRAPVTTPAASGVVATHGQKSIAASNLFHATDPDGDAITQYALWDTGGSGHWSVNGVAQAAGVEIDITAAQWAQTTYVFGAAGTPSDLLYVKAYDVSQWGNWTSALTATPGPDKVPVVTAANVAIASGRSIAASSLFTASDPDGDTLTTYAFWDSSSNGHFAVGGVTQLASTEIDVTAAHLATTSYVAGPGTDQLYVRVNDGAGWSGWQAFTAGPVAPVVTASNLTTALGQTLAASNLFKVSNPDGGTLTYALWDSNINGHFTVGGIARSSNTEIDVTAAQLASTSYVSGMGTDQLYVKVNGSTLSSGWQPFTATGISPANINAGATLELGSAYAGQVTFLGSTGLLKLDNAASFAGAVAGMTAQDTIDFAGINFASIQAPTLQNATSTSGTLHVTDGTHTANIALLGNYLASTFAASSDGHGGTLIVDPPASQTSMLAQPAHA